VINRRVIIYYIIILLLLFGVTCSVLWRTAAPKSRRTILAVETAIRSERRRRRRRLHPTKARTTPAIFIYTAAAVLTMFFPLSFGIPGNSHMCDCRFLLRTIKRRYDKNKRMYIITYTHKRIPRKIEFLCVLKWYSILYLNLMGTQLYRFIFSIR